MNFPRRESFDLLVWGRQHYPVCRRYQPVINTTDFVRNIDLAFDMGSFLLDKLGIEPDKFLEKFNKITDVIF